MGKKYLKGFANLGIIPVATNTAIFTAALQPREGTVTLPPLPAA